jgi:hypothetical protein
MESGSQSRCQKRSIRPSQSNLVGERRGRRPAAANIEVAPRHDPRRRGVLRAGSLAPTITHPSPLASA